MPKKDKQVFSQELINILSKAADNKIYGSVEIFFESGSITQVTQRIINKVNKPKQLPPKTSNHTKKPSVKIKSTSHKTTDDIPPATRTP